MLGLWSWGEKRGLGIRGGKVSHKNKVVEGNEATTEVSVERRGAL